MKIILIVLCLTFVSFAQYTPLRNNVNGKYLQMANGDTVANMVWVVGNSATDTIYYAVPDTAVNKKLTYGDSILQVRHTNPYFFFQFTIYDSLVATSGTLTDSLVFERYNDFSLTWEGISVVRQSDQVPVSVLVPGSGVTRTYLVRLPYPSYETTLRIRRTNVNDIVGRSTWVSVKAIGN